MKIPTPNPKTRSKSFMEAAGAYLEGHRVRFLEQLKADPAHADRCLQHARDSMLLPNEGLEHLGVGDLFGVYPSFYEVKIKAGVMTEAQAKVEIKQRVETALQSWNNL